MINIDFTQDSNIALFPSANEIIKLPADVDLIGSTTIRISGSDFIMEFPNGKSITLLFGGIFTSIGNTLTIQDNRGTSLDLNELISSYEVLVSNNVLLQPIDAIALNQLLEKIPESEGQEIASGAAEFGEGGVAQGSADEGVDGKQQGREGSTETEQETEFDFKLTSDRETDEDVEKVTGSGATEAGGEDDLAEESDVNQFDSREEKTKDFQETIQQLSAVAEFDTPDEAQAAGASQARARNEGSVADSDAPVQTTLELQGNSDSGSSNTDRITNLSSLVLSGTSVNEASINIFIASEFANNIDETTGLTTATPLNGTTSILVPTDPLNPDVWTFTLDLSILSPAQLAAAGLTINADDQINGDLSLIAQPIAANGTIGVASSAILISVDQSIEIPTVELSSNFVSALDPTFTNDSTFAINGTAEAGSVIQIFVDGSVIPLTTTEEIVANANGLWNINFEEGQIPPGENSIIVSSTDLAGNEAVSEQIIVNLDTIAPPTPQITTITTDTGIFGPGFVGDNTPTVNGLSVANTFIVVSIDGVAQAPQLTNADGSFAIETTSITEGPHEFTVMAIDRAGNQSEQSTPPVSIIVANPSSQLTIGLAEASDSGISGDNITNVNQDLALTGTGAVGEILQLSTTTADGETVLGTVEVDVNSNWIFTLSDTQIDGSQTFTVSRTSTLPVVSESVDILIDSTINSPVIELNEANLVDGIFYLNVPTGENPTGNLVVNIEAGSTINVALGGAAVVATAVANNNGQGTIDISTLGLNTVGISASNTISVAITDAAGNELMIDGESSVDTQLIINPPPVITPDLSLSVGDMTGGTPNPTFTRNTDVTLVGNTTPGAIVQIFQIQSGESILVAQVIADETTGNFSSPASLTPLTEGLQTVQAQAFNLAGVPTTSQLFSFTVDTTPSSAPLISLDDNSNSGVNDDLITNAPTVTINGSSVDGSVAQGDTISLFINGAIFVIDPAIVADSNGNFSANIPLTEGLNQITAISTDQAGNISTVSSSLDITLDTSLSTPTIQVADTDQAMVTGFDPNPAFTNNPQVRLEGTADPNSSISVELTLASQTVITLTTVADDNGNWFVVPSPALAQEGTYTATATAEDIAANDATSSPITFTLDITPPAAPALVNISIVDVIDNTTNDVTPEFNVSGLEPDYFVQFANAATNQTFTPIQVDAFGNASFQVPIVLLDGPNSFTAVQIDLAGNVSPSTTITFNIDAPDTSGALTLNIDDDDGSDTGTQGDNVTSASTINLEGTGAPEENLNIYVENTFVGTATVDFAGNWAFSGVDLTEGVQIVSAVIGSELPFDSDGSRNPAITADNIVSESIRLDTAVTTLSINFTEANLGSDGVYNLNSPVRGVLEVTTEAFSQVQIDLGADRVLTTTSDINGTASLSLTDIIDSISSTAPNTFQIDVIDPAGNQESGSVTLNFDTQNPSISLELDVANQTFLTAFNTIYDNSTNDANDNGLNDAIDAIIAGNSATTPTNTNDSSFVINGTTFTDINNITRETEVQLTILFEIVSIVDAAGSSVAIPDDSFAVVGGSATNVGATTPTLTADGSLLSDADGNFSATVPAALIPIVSAGQAAIVNVTVAATDLAGNQTTQTTNITVDRIPPDQPIIELLTASDTGAINTDNITSINNPTLSGRAEAGSVVTVLNNGTPIVFPSPIVADVDGNWTQVLTQVLPDGDFTLTVLATDSAGNTSAVSEPLNITIDTQISAPSNIALADANQGILVDTNPDNSRITNDQNYQITGNGEVGATITATFTAGAMTAVANATVLEDGTWVLTAPTTLPEGSHSININIVDVAGNTLLPESQVSFSVTLDTTSPSAADILETGANAAGFISTDEPTISVTTEQQNNFAIVLIDPNEALLLSLQNAADLPTTTEEEIETQRQAFNNISVVDASDQTLTGAAALISQAASVLDLNGVNTQSFQAASLAEGQHTIVTVIIDDAGNITFTNTSGADIETITVDTQSPTTTLALAVDALGNVIDDGDFDPETNPATQTIGTFVSGENTISLQGVATEPGGNLAGLTVDIRVDGVMIGSTAVDSIDGSWNFDLTGTAIAAAIPSAAGFPDGNYVITASAVDAAGNSTGSDVAPELTLIRDQQFDPEVTINLQTGSSIPADITSGSINTLINDSLATNTSQTTPTFGGAAEGRGALDTVTISITDSNGEPVTNSDGDPVLPVQINLINDNTWQYTLPSALVDGVYEVSVTGEDAAENTDTATLTFTVDTSTSDLTGSTPGFALTSTATQFGVGNPPEFTGTALAGSFVVIRDASTNAVYDIVQADSSGAWNATPIGIPEALGTMLTFQNLDAAANLSPDTLSLTISIDNTPVPDIPPGTTVALNNDTGESSSDKITSENNNLSILGTIPGAIPSGADQLLVFIDTVLVATLLPANFTGDNFSVIIPNGDTDTFLNDQTHIVQLTFQNDFGSSGAGQTFTYTIDSVAPNVPTLAFETATTMVVDNTTNDTIVIQGTAGQPGENVTVGIEFSLDGGTTFTAFPATTTTDASGNYRLELFNLADGDYTFRTTATDAAGNTNNSAPANDLSVTLDTEIVLTFDNPIVNTTTPIFTGTTDAEALVDIEIGGITNQVTADADGNWQFNVGSSGLSVSNGDTVTINADDGVNDTDGTADEIIATITVDASPPGAPALNTIGSTNFGGASGTTGQSALSLGNSTTVNGTAEENSTVQVFIGTDTTGQPLTTFQTDDTGNWSGNINIITPSATIYSFVAVDAAGNASSSTTAALSSASSRFLPSSLFASDSVVETASNDDENVTETAPPESVQPAPVADETVDAAI